MEIKHRVLLTLLSGAASAAFSVTLGQPAFPMLSAAADGVAEGGHAPAAGPARAAATTCYGGREQVKLEVQVVDDEYGVAFDSPALWVKRGSPCRDINVRDPRNLDGPATGAQVCTLVKVLLGDGRDPVGFVDTCAGWKVLMKFVPDGTPFVLRAAIRPVEVTVAS